MAVTPLTPVNVSRAGLDLTTAGTAGNTDGMTFPNDGNTFLRVKNAGGTACVLSLLISRTVDGQTPAARSVTIPITTGDKIIGPFPVVDYGSTVTVDPDQVTSVTFWALTAIG